MIKFSNKTLKSKSKSKSKKSKSKSLKIHSPNLEKILPAELKISMGTIPKNSDLIPVADLTSKSKSSYSSASTSSINSNSINATESFYKIKLISKDKKITDEDISNLNKYLSKFKKGLKIIIKYAPKNKITIEPKIIEEIDKIIKLKEKDVPPPPPSLDVETPSKMLWLYKLSQFSKNILVGLINIAKTGIWSILFKLIQGSYILFARIPMLFIGGAVTNGNWLISLLGLYAISAATSSALAILISAAATMMFMYFFLATTSEIFGEVYKLFFVWS